jgi:hypothetical protein
MYMYVSDRLILVTPADGSMVLRRVDFPGSGRVTG